MASAFDKQIQNRNFLSPIGFRFTLAKYPKISFFSTSARLPEISLGTAIQPSYLKDLDVPGDKLTYGDFNLRFYVDENMQNYMTVHNWMTGLGFPETAQQYANATTNDEGLRDEKEVFSDGSLTILNSNYRSIASVKFKNLFPISISSLEFESSDTDINYFTADVTFKYTIYNILGTDGNPL